MDINSREAIALDMAFINAKMKLVPEGLLNVQTNALYGKTNRGRLVRYDRNTDQYNVLTSNRKNFAPVTSLLPGEAIMTGANLRRHHLLPDKTNWETFKEKVVPGLGQAGIMMALGMFLHGIWAGIPAALGAFKNFFTGQEATPQMHGPMAGAAFGASHGPGIALPDVSAAQSGDWMPLYDATWAGDQVAMAFDDFHRSHAGG